MKLLGIFIPHDILARSNCTEAIGREMVNPKILQAIRVSYIILHKSCVIMLIRRHFQLVSIHHYTYLCPHMAHIHNVKLEFKVGQ